MLAHTRTHTHMDTRCAGEYRFSSWASEDADEIADFRLNVVPPQKTGKEKHFPLTLSYSSLCTLSQLGRCRYVA